MSWNGLLPHFILVLFMPFLISSNALLVRYGTNTPCHMNWGRILMISPLFHLNSHPAENYDGIYKDDDGEDDDDDDIKDAYGSRSLSWTRRYRALLPYEYARRRVLSLGLESKADWDEYVSDGKRGNGAYLPNRPDLMYATEWQGWDEFLGLIRTYSETRHMVQHILKLRSRLTYEVFIYENPKRAELLRIPALPWIVYENKGWIDDEHFFGCGADEGMHESYDLS